MAKFDRFAVLRQALPQDRYGDDEIATIVDRCCELEFAAGSVVLDVGQRVDEWLIVADGRLEVRDGDRRWIAGSGAIVQPSWPGLAGVSVVRLVALEPTTVLQVTVVGGARRP